MGDLFCVVAGTLVIYSAIHSLIGNVNAVLVCVGLFLIAFGVKDQFRN